MTADSITLAQRYALENVIASGGMATVWRARDDVLARPVAVKILHPQLADDEAFVERFRREALAAARLAHPHIVSIYDTGSEPDPQGHGQRHFIVMEFCGGGTLGDLLEEQGSLDPSQAAETVALVCDALAYAHRNGIVHRDIKPQNVLLTDQRALKVADFGIAKAAFSKTEITATGALLGTVTYLSPEQILGEEPGPRSDIYSAGILLHELIAGAPPFQADTQIATAMAHARERPPPLRSLRAGIPAGLERVVLKALAKDPADRFQTAEEMAGALRGSADTSATGVLEPLVPETAGAEVEGRSRGRELRWLLPVLLLIAAAVAAAFFVPGLLEGDEEPGPSTPGEDGPPVALEVQSVTDFDSLPEEQEHPEEAQFAIDGDPTTPWGTETYSTPMHEVKDGVGLVLDLGQPEEVTRVRLISTTPGYDVSILTSDEGGTSLDAYDEVTQESAVPEKADIEIDSAEPARYWLVLITRLPGDGSGTVDIGEVKLFGS